MYLTLSQIESSLRAAQLIEVKSDVLRAPWAALQSTRDLPAEIAERMEAMGHRVPESRKQAATAK